MQEDSVDNVEQIEDVQTDADNGSPRGVDFVSISDEDVKSSSKHKHRNKSKKIRPTQETAQQNKARIGISWGRKEFVGKQLELLLNAVAETGYSECEILVGGFVQRHNFLRNLAAREKQLGPAYPAEYAGKQIAELTSAEIENLVQTSAFKAEAEAYGKQCEATWFEKNGRYIENLRARGIKVDVIFWEKAAESEEVKRLHKLVEDICKEQEEGAANSPKGEAEYPESEMTSRLSKLKKELYTNLMVAVDQIWATQVGEEDNASSYRDTLLKNKEVFLKEIGKFIKEELGVLPSPHSHFIYPMERHPGARMICKTLEKLAAIAGIEMRVFSANYKPASPKANPQASQNDNRRNSGSEPPQKKSSSSPPSAIKRKGSAGGGEEIIVSSDSSTDHEEPQNNPSATQISANSAVGFHRATSKGQPVPNVNRQRKGQEGSPSTSSTDSSSSSPENDQALLLVDLEAEMQATEAEIQTASVLTAIAGTAAQAARANPQNPQAVLVGLRVAQHCLDELMHLKNGASLNYTWK